MKLKLRIRNAPTLLTALVLAPLIVIATVRLWDRYVEHGLARWAVDETARRTDGAYHLALSHPSFMPLAGSIAVDLLVVTTDSLANHRRESPLPTLEWRAQDCRVTGLDVVRVLLRRSFVARELGCDRMTGTLVLPPSLEQRQEHDSTGTAARALDPVRPLGLSSFRIASISIPRLSFTLTQPRDSGHTSVRSEHVRFEARDLEFDPGADPSARATLSAKDARLTGTGLELLLSSRYLVKVSRFDASLSDSTLRVIGARHEPRIPEQEWVQRHRFRRDRITLDLDSLMGRGVAWSAFLATGELSIRAVELDGPRLDVLSDWRLPRGRPTHHRSPQQVAAAHRPAFRLDSLVVSRGRIVYRERRPKRDRPGWVSFDSVRGTALHVDLPSRGQPLTISARTRVMNEGWLTANASVPLFAPDFRYQLSGNLDRMPATAFNQMLSKNEAYEFADGWIEGVTFRQAASRGRTVTTMTPRYHDLSVQPTGEGGGLIGSVKRSVQKLVVNAFKVRSRNPGEDGKDLRTVRTSRRFDPSDSLVPFLWLTLRDGLMETIKE